MKIKAQPQDFIVEEVLGTPLREKGPFCVYLLEKRGQNTDDAVQRISRNLRLPDDRITYAGRKDRHALSRQHIAIQGQTKPAEIKEKGFNLSFAGFLDRPLGPDLIRANRFTIIVRDLGPQEEGGALDEISAISRFGVPNYFDDQRFGSRDDRMGFFAEKVLKDHHNGALKNYLLRHGTRDRKEDRARKDFFFAHWGQWQDCLLKAKTVFERTAFSHLAQKPKDFIPLLKKIPDREVSLFFSAYQSFLWNEVLRRLLKSRLPSPLSSCPGLAGDYLFFRRLGPEDLRAWRKLTIPTAASKMTYADEAVRKASEEVLRDNGLKNSMFNLTKIRQAYFKSAARDALVFPQELRAEPGADELYESRRKLTLKFSLPAGSFATMLVKRMFCEKR